MRIHMLGYFLVATLCAATVGPEGAAARGTVPAPASATHYDFVDLRTLGGTSSTPNGINDRGLVTGPSFCKETKSSTRFFGHVGGRLTSARSAGTNSAVNWAVKADTGEIAGVSQLSKTDPFADLFRR